ncbi:MAG: ABC transporter permease [Halobacteriales archaeon]
MATWGDDAAFERVDWAEVGRDRYRPSARVLTFAIGAIALVGAYLYNRYEAHVYLVFDWQVETVDWIFLLGTLILLSFGVVPALQRYGATWRTLTYLLRRPSTAFALLFLTALLALGLFGPVVIERPLLRFGHAWTPPVGIVSEVSGHSCAGEQVGEPFNFKCKGTWEHPLGTSHRGHPLEFLLMTGARSALYVIVFTAAFVVPLGIVTGVIAGLRGGLIDDLLMSVVDVQLFLPAIVVYFIAYTYFNVSLLLLLLTFGLLSWGGVARLVRSEVLQRREEGHILVARSLGASTGYLARRHLLPNVSNTIIPAAFHLLALLILVEAGVAFLGFHDIELFSWGSTIAESTNSRYTPGIYPPIDVSAIDVWWASTFPAIAIALTMLSFKLLGDGLRDALDPRMNA